MTPCKELKRISRANLTGNYRIPMGALIICLGLPMIIELPFSYLLNTEYAVTYQKIIYLLAELLIAIIAGMLNIGMVYIHLQLARHEKIERPMVYYCFHNVSEKYIYTIAIKLLLSLICLVPAILGYFFLPLENSLNADLEFIGLIILSLCLLMILALNYGLVYYVLLDNEKESVLFAFKESRRLLKGKRGRLLYIYLSFIGLLLLAMLSFGIGLLWVNPYQYQTLANFYLEIEKASHFSCSI